MSKISERLKAYQTQMSIYAEQHKVILASDVLDIIEQLQDDLKDSINKVVEELGEKKEIVKEYEKYHYSVRLDDAIDIVKRGGVE